MLLSRDTSVFKKGLKVTRSCTHNKQPDKPTERVMVKRPSVAWESQSGSTAAGEPWADSHVGPPRAALTIARLSLFRIVDWYNQSRPQSKAGHEDIHVSLARRQPECCDQPRASPGKSSPSRDTDLNPFLCGAGDETCGLVQARQVLALPLSYIQPTKHL